MKLKFNNFYSSPRCKVCLLWSQDFLINHVVSHPQFEAFNVTFLPWRIQFHLVIVYAEHTRLERQALWQDLTSFLAFVPGLTIVGGDFNSIASSSEYRGSSTRNWSSMQDLSGLLTLQVCRIKCRRANSTLGQA